MVESAYEETEQMLKVNVNKLHLIAQANQKETLEAAELGSFNGTWYIRGFGRA